MWRLDSEEKRESLKAILRETPCICCQHNVPSDPAHFPRTRTHSDAMIPLCNRCHREQHQMGWKTWLTQNRQVVERLVQVYDLALAQLNEEKYAKA